MSKGCDRCGHRKKDHLMDAFCVAMVWQMKLCGCPRYLKPGTMK